MDSKFYEFFLIYQIIYNIYNIQILKLFTYNNIKIFKFILPSMFYQILFQ